MKFSTKIKNGFTLVQIMVALLVVTILIAASMPMITKRVERPNSRFNHGKYICYRDENGVLQQAYYNSIRQISKEEAFVEKQEDENGDVIDEGGERCTFNPPTRANIFKVELIGAGSGGYDYYDKKERKEDLSSFYSAYSGSVISPETLDLEEEDKSNLATYTEPSDEQVRALLNGTIYQRVSQVPAGGDGRGVSIEYPSYHAVYCSLSVMDSYSSGTPKTRFYNYFDPVLNANMENGNIGRYWEDDKISVLYDYAEWNSENPDNKHFVQIDPIEMGYTDYEDLMKYHLGEDGVSVREQAFLAALKDEFAKDDAGNYATNVVWVPEHMPEKVRQLCATHNLGNFRYHTTVLSGNSETDPYRNDLKGEIKTEYYATNNVDESDEATKYDPRPGEPGYKLVFNYQLKTPYIESKSILSSALQSMVQLGVIENNVYKEGDTSSGSLTGSTFYRFADYWYKMKDGKIVFNDNYVYHYFPVDEENGKSTDGKAWDKFKAFRVNGLSQQEREAEKHVFYKNKYIPAGGDGAQAVFCKDATVTDDGLCGGESTIGHIKLKETRLTKTIEELEEEREKEITKWVDFRNSSSGNWTGLENPARTDLSFAYNVFATDDSVKNQYPGILVKVSLPVYTYVLGKAGKAGEYVYSAQVADLQDCTFNVPKGGEPYTSDTSTSELEYMQKDLITSISCNQNSFNMSAKGGSYDYLNNDTKTYEHEFNTLLLLRNLRENEIPSLGSYQTTYSIDPQGEDAPVEIKAEPSKYTPHNVVFTKHNLGLPADLGAGGYGAGFDDKCAAIYGNYSLRPAYSLTNSFSDATAIDGKQPWVGTIEKPSCDQEEQEAKISATAGKGGAVIISW